MTTEYCAYPECQGYHEKDSDQKKFISAIPWFCGAHVWCYIRCNHADGCDRYNVYVKKEDVPATWYCQDHTAEPVPAPQTMKVPCSFPDCPGFKTVDPTEAMHDEPIRWLCAIHKKWIGMTCQKDGCTTVAFYPKESAPTFYWCAEHEAGPPLNQVYATTPLKPGEHPRIVLQCDYPDCYVSHQFDVADQIPAKWCCSEHVSSTEHDYELLKELEARLVKATKQIVDLKATNAKLGVATIRVTDLGLNMMKKLAPLISLEEIKRLNEVMADILERYSA